MAPKRKQAAQRGAGRGTKAARYDAAASPAASSSAGASSSLPTPAQVESSQAVASANKRRLARRDTDEQVERIISDRLLSKYPADVVHGSVSKGGETVQQYLSKAVRDNKGSQKKLSSKFWVEFFKDFDMQVNPIKNLPEPTSLTETVDPALVAAMKIAHHENPAVRSSDPFERHLEICAAPNYKEYYGMLSCSVESRAVTKATSAKMTKAIAALIRRFSVLYFYI